MTVGKKEDVLTVSIHIKAGLPAENVEIEGHKKLRAAQRTTGVPALAGMNHANDVSADL